MGKSWTDSTLRFSRGAVETRIRRLPSREDGLVEIRVGGLPEVSGYYCVYRGTRDQAIAALEHAAKQLRAIDELPEPQFQASGNPSGNTEA